MKILIKPFSISAHTKGTDEDGFPFRKKKYRFLLVFFVRYSTRKHGYTCFYDSEDRHMLMVNFS